MKPDYFDKAYFPPIFDEFNEFFKEQKNYIRSNAKAKSKKGNRRNGTQDRRQAFKNIASR